MSASLVWHKPGGFQSLSWPQYNYEFVLYARHRRPRFTALKAFSTCFNAPRREHSMKPDEFYTTVRRVTSGRRLDLFVRRKIAGFAGRGQEYEYI
jgi:N6-adenosine-specific RNA methylase IME4